MRGAAKEKINKWRRIRLRSTPSDIKNETRPKAAGAYQITELIIIRNMMIVYLLYEA